ncbi:primase homolog protein-like isoform X2 [Euphorbia lathyris]|uniref:primase homolog protein-like isoform X2 n=1 Tax=Euphorbia lathyris TaxID=212925 RepID=UPI003313FF2A
MPPSSTCSPSKLAFRFLYLSWDTKYGYLWNCKEYLKKAFHVILVTDGDLPGQALVEELACCIGRERCWRVRWPKKSKDEHFKDANEQWSQKYCALSTRNFLFTKLSQG